MKKDEFEARLDRNHLNVVRRTSSEGEDEILSFEDIVTESSLQLAELSTWCYQTQPTVFQNKLDNANNKTQAWTDSLEAEAAAALAEVAVPANDGLHHEAHRFQIWYDIIYFSSDTYFL